MVVSLNNQPHESEFKNLIDTTLHTLREQSSKDSVRYLTLLGNKLENEVFDILEFNSRGTVFEGSIELVSGQKFPDIVANKYYGIEVKTTKSNHWTSIGSSVAEGTRDADIKRIYMLFGKMVKPVEFLCKPYEECLSEVVVTHSPRYTINMKLEPGQTIFDKINIPYDELRNLKDPIGAFLNYYKSKLKKGDQVWWLNHGNNNTSSLIIKVWNNLDTQNRKIYMTKGYSYFPEVLSKRPDKYNAFAVWLSTEERIICPNVRDIYSSAGQGQIKYNGETYFEIPKVIIRLLENINEIKKIILETKCEILSDFWNVNVENHTKLSIWFNLFEENSDWILIKKPVIAQIIRNELFT